MSFSFLFTLFSALFFCFASFCARSCSEWLQSLLRCNRCCSRCCTAIAAASRPCCRRHRNHYCKLALQSLLQSVPQSLPVLESLQSALHRCCSWRLNKILITLSPVISVPYRCTNQDEKYVVGTGTYAWLLANERSLRPFSDSMWH